MHCKQPVLDRQQLDYKMQRMSSRHAAPLLVHCSGLKKQRIFSEDTQERAISILRSTQQFDWRNYIRKTPADGSLIISDEEHKEVVQQAAKDKNLSFGFSAGGCLFPYYIGASGALQDADLLTDETKLGGASAGSLIAACIKSGMPLDQVTEQCLRLMHDCRVNGTRGRLGPVLEKFLMDHLPDDAHERCADRAFVAVTKALPVLRPQLVSTFESREDLIQALMTSCHVPYWMDGSAVTEFRGDLHLDGGITNFIPIAPGTVGVRICCFPSKQLSPVYRIGISPDTFEPWPYSLRQMVQWALQPADENMTQFFIDKGKSDAQAWMESMGLGKESSKAEEKAQEGGQVAAAKAAAAGTDSHEAQAAASEKGKEEIKQRAQQQQQQEEGQQHMEQQEISRVT